MLVSFSDLPQQVDFVDGTCYENDNFHIGWKGVLFQYGARAGTESVARIADLLEHQTLADLCRLLHGIFVLFIFDKRSTTWHVMVDNSGLYHAFHDDAAVGTSFLKMLELRARSGRNHLAPAAVADFLAYGGIYWSRTLVEEISKIRYDEIIELGRQDALNGMPKRIVQKRLPPRGSIGEDAFVAHYANLALALERERVSVDLTGGFDSRLTACLMNAHGIEFETAAVGRPSIPDVAIAGEAAARLGKAFYVTHHDASAIEHELHELFREVDGLADVLDYHRSRQLSAERRRRGLPLWSPAPAGNSTKISGGFRTCHSTTRELSISVDFTICASDRSARRRIISRVR
jgi:asparagine synthetase B (glutamine-hydrolysing)